MRITQLVIFLTMIFLSATSWANEVMCDIEYASQVTTVKLEPVQDPYQLTNVDLRGNYRLTTQLLESHDTLPDALMTSKLKTYIYYQSKGRYALIHAAEYAVAESNCAPPHDHFGINRVYDSYLERELIFQCRLVCR